jgi:hypothetical protein
MNEKAISIAARFYEARTRAREILGSQYQPTISKYIGCINRLCSRENITTLQAAQACIKFSLQDQDAIGAMKFMAACVEIIEPSNAQPSPGGVAAPVHELVGCEPSNEVKP